MNKKRTTVDFSNHDLKTIMDPSTKIWILQKGKSFTHKVTFINTQNIMSVTGDFGNWIFNREFHPSKDNYVSEHYWCEKLSILSEQQYKEFDSDYTIELLDERIKELEDYPYANETDQQKAILHFKLCKEYVDDEIDYIQEARNYPNFMDSESAIIIGKKIKYWLLVIFDAFDEICKRYKNKFEQIDSKRKEKLKREVRQQKEDEKIEFIKTFFIWFDNKLKEIVKKDLSIIKHELTMNFVYKSIHEIFELKLKEFEEEREN